MEPARTNAPTPKYAPPRKPLGVFVPSLNAAEHVAQAGDTKTFRGRARLTPAATLREFVEAWFIPVVYRGEKAVKPRTIQALLEAVAWWEVMTGDPALGDVDPYTLADLQDGLRGATWRKGPCAPIRPLARATQVKHLKAIRNVLERVGPTYDRQRLAANLLDSIPYLRVVGVKRETPGPSFTVDECRAITAAALRLRDPHERLAWLVRLSLMFYCGLRIGSTLATRAAMIEERTHAVLGRRSWLVIPADDVKTGRSLAVPLHAEALAAIRRLPVGADYLCAWHQHPRTLTTVHERLQREADVDRPSATWQGRDGNGGFRGFHAWRRTHADQLNLLGAEFAQRTSQAALDHASADTTRDSYSNARLLLIDQLPKLVVECDGHGQRRLF